MLSPRPLPPVFSGAGFIHAVKAVENVRQRTFGNSDSGVRYSQSTLAAVRPFQLDSNFATRRGILNCIVENVSQHLSQT